MFAQQALPSVPGDGGWPAEVAARRQAHLPLGVWVFLLPPDPGATAHLFRMVEWGTNVWECITLAPELFLPLTGSRVTTAVSSRLLPYHVYHSVSPGLHSHRRGVRGAEKAS